MAAAGAARGGGGGGGPGQPRQPGPLGGRDADTPGLGFRVRCGPEVFQPRAYGVATDRLVARRFEEIWLDPEVKAVIWRSGAAMAP